MTHHKAKKVCVEEDVQKYRSLVWFRSDLRVKDNSALSQASCFKGTPDGVIGLYIISPYDWSRHDWGPKKVDFIKRNLKELSKKLAEEYNIPLLILEVESFAKLPSSLIEFCKKHSISSVWFNNESEWDENLRDRAVEEALLAQNIFCRRFQDQCIVEPGLVLTKESRPYSVFTPFKNTWSSFLEKNPPKLESDPVVQMKSTLDTKPSDIDAHFEKLPKDLIYNDNQELLDSLWPAGESEANRRLEDFSKLRIQNYKKTRDFPYLSNGTSSLSPYLAIGVVSVKTCFLKARTENNGKLSTGSEGICTWISELCWRDFYRHILFHFPRVGRGQPFKIESDKVAWRYPNKNDMAAKEDFDRWCRGQTGFPIVDAAMRQLNETGWMHNRLRMIVSMFLTKDLLIDWREGEKYFMKHLIDGDFASNNGGWQWSASTGTDSQPYFRVFNPTTQSENFDPDGEFIRRFVPELTNIPLKFIHEPSKNFSPEALRSLDYFKPMIDHAKARVKAIEAFKKVFSKVK